MQRVETRGAPQNPPRVDRDGRPVQKMTGQKGTYMNAVHLLGRLARDPEAYEPKTKDGVLTVKLTLAVQRDKEHADFIRCTAFGQTAETIDKYLTKGQQIAVTGRIQTGSYEKDGQTVYTTDVIIDRFYFAEGKKPEEPEEKPEKASGSRYAGRERRR